MLRKNGILAMINTGLPVAQPAETPGGEYRTPVGYAPPREATARRELEGRNSGMAIASLVLGIIAVVLLVITWIPVIGWLSFGPAVLAVIFGGLGLRETNRTPGLKGRGQAVAGLVLGIIAGVIGLLFRLAFMGL